MAQRIQIRRGTVAGWTAANPVLAVGEPAFEIDTGLFKYGDGVTAWNDLPYSGGSAADHLKSAAVVRFHDGTSWPSAGTIPENGIILWVSFTAGVIDPPEFVEERDLLFVPS